MDQLATFWKTNADAIIVSLVVGFIFFVLGPIGVWFSGRKIRKERQRKAKDLLVDLVEGMIVTQEEVTSGKLGGMFRAVEREVEVEIGDSYDVERLFEDVMLRFQRSKHLDSGQKDAYSKRMSELSESFKQAEKTEERVMPRRYVQIFDDLRAATDATDRDKLTALISELEKRLIYSREQDPIFGALNGYRRMAREHPILLIVAFLGTLAFYVYVLVQFGVFKL
ncbi:MAG: hypothetical protein C0607_00560 [Azoarcus sp.]|nr:MAG: hypothetical protein C0607_00560 [Azoarcus sp.]